MHGAPPDPAPSLSVSLSLCLSFHMSVSVSQSVSLPLTVFLLQVVAALGEVDPFPPAYSIVITRLFRGVQQVPPGRLSVLQVDQKPRIRLLTTADRYRAPQYRQVLELCVHGSG